MSWKSSHYVDFAVAINEAISVVFGNKLGNRASNDVKPEADEISAAHAAESRGMGKTASAAASRHKVGDMGNLAHRYSQDTSITLDIEIDICRDWPR